MRLETGVDEGGWGGREVRGEGQKGQWKGKELKSEIQTKDFFVSRN